MVDGIRTQDGSKPILHPAPNDSVGNTTGTGMAGDARISTAVHHSAGQRYGGDSCSQIEVNQNFFEALAEAWPYARELLVIFGFVILGFNSFVWSVAKTPDRWAWVLMASVFFWVASELGRLGRNFLFGLFFIIGIITALWI